jgi:hypothetical protein
MLGVRREHWFTKGMRPFVALSRIWELNFRRITFEEKPTVESCVGVKPAEALLSLMVKDDLLRKEKTFEEDYSILRSAANQAYELREKRQ